jgi:hypothetical protein
VGKQEGNKRRKKKKRIMNMEKLYDERETWGSKNGIKEGRRRKE